MRDNPYNNPLWNALPPHSRDSLKKYLEFGYPTGHFLTALLSNDLYGAVSRADDENQAAIVDYVKYLVNYAPAISWGNPENVKNWPNELKARKEQG